MFFASFLTLRLILFQQVYQFIDLSTARFMLLVKRKINLAVLNNTKKTLTNHQETDYNCARLYKTTRGCVGIGRQA